MQAPSWIAALLWDGAALGTAGGQDLLISFKVWGWGSTVVLGVGLYYFCHGRALPAGQWGRGYLE